MPDALIGCTGFVGSNLARQMSFADLYHSRNVADIRGKAYDTVVCAVVRAEKWKANQDPDGDRAGIRSLAEHLTAATARRLVLISTVDVYPTPVGVDEDTPIDPTAATPYGRHRYELERELAGHFDTTVIRLPGLFGDGLKKNVVFDLLHNNLVDRINPAGVYQYYCLDRIAADVRRTRDLGLKLVNFATEPVSTAELARAAFGRELPSVTAPAGRYDFRSRHAERYGGRDGYLYTKDQVLADLTRFVANYRPARRAA